MKSCPFCGEEVQEEAVKCRYCKEWLSKPGENTQQSVRDPVIAQPASRPGKVGTAVTLLYISLGIGFLRIIMEASRFAQMTSTAFLMFIVFFALGIMWFFIFMIDKGRNWARITFLVLFIIAIPFSVLPLLQGLAVDPFSVLLGIGQTVIQLIALVFLFQRASSDWFREMKVMSGRLLK